MRFVHYKFNNVSNAMQKWKLLLFTFLSVHRFAIYSLHYMQKTGIRAEIEILGHAHFSLVLIDVIMSPLVKNIA